MRPLTVLLTLALALPLYVGCRGDAPLEPIPPTEVRVQPRSAPAPAPAAEPAPTPPEAPEPPLVSIEVNLGTFNARAFSSFTACSIAAMALSGQNTRCRSNCECMGAFRGADSQTQCLLSCSVD